MGLALCRVVVELGNGFEEVGMLNAMAWALACFGVVAADIALSVVLFSVLDAVSVLTGYPIGCRSDGVVFDGAAVVALSVAPLLHGAPAR